MLDRTTHDSVTNDEMPHVAVDTIKRIKQLRSNWQLRRNLIKATYITGVKLLMDVAAVAKRTVL
jgi:hypothetical protein